MGDVLDKKLLNATQFAHQEILDVDDKDVLFVTLGANPILRYIDYNDSRIRVTHYIERLTKEAGEVKFYNRDVTIQAVGFRNKCLKEVRDNKYLSPKAKAFSIFLKENPKTIEMLDMYYIRQYISDPKYFEKKNKTFCDIVKIKNVYNNNLKTILENKELANNFIKLKDVKSQINYLKLITTEQNFNKIINSVEHSMLITNKALKGTNPDVDKLAKLSAKGIGTALSSILFAYDYSNYDGIDKSNDPVYKLLENSLLSYGVSTALPYIFTALTIPISSPILLSIVVIVTTTVIVDKIDDIIVENDILGLADKTNYGLRSQIIKDKYKSKVYFVIEIFFKKYQIVIRNFNNIIKTNISNSKSKNKNSILFPKPLSKDNLDPRKFKPKKISLFCKYPLDQLDSILITNKAIEDYISSIEKIAYVDASVIGDLHSPNNKYLLSTTTYQNTPMATPKNFSKNKFESILDEDILHFYEQLNNWSETQSIYIPSEFSKTYLFKTIEKYL